MKEIVITTQAELDALPLRFSDPTRIVIKNTSGERIRISQLCENASAVLCENASAVLWGNASAVLRGNASAVLCENASAELCENASAVLCENASAELRGNASAVLCENASAVLWGNASALLWGNTSAVLCENASAELRGNASAVLRGNALVRVQSSAARAVLYGCSVAFIGAPLAANVEKKSTSCHVQLTLDLGWFERNAVDKAETVVLYKKVSKDFKTQAGTGNETVWTIGTTVTVPNWNTASECGPGKFHACSRPYFCNEFRNQPGDRYIAISIKLKDLHEWTDDPKYPHKIAFRSGTVLYECDRFGREVNMPPSLSGKVK